MDFGGMAQASESVVETELMGYHALRPVKRSRALLGSNPTRNNRADGAPKARGPAGESSRAPSLRCCGVRTPE